VTNAADSLARKLNFKAGMKVRVIDKPGDVDLGDLSIAASELSGGVIAFVSRLEDVDGTCAPVIEEAKRDGLAWICYPKAGKLGTDLNRDILWQHLLDQGIQGVRQVSIDATWSAMRFRPKK
jgi:translation elongation factor EF-G